MKTRTIIAMVIFLSLCAVKLLLPAKASEIRNSIIPAISHEPNYRQEIIALGRTLSGAGSSLYTLENRTKANADSSEDTVSAVSPRPSFGAASADGFVLSDMVNQNLSQFKSPLVSPSVSPDAESAESSSPEAQNSSPSPRPSTPAAAPEATAPVTASSAFIAPDTAPIEEATPESKLKAKLDAFLNEEAAFADYKIPDNVSCEAPVLPFKFSSPSKSAVSSTFGYRVHPIYNDVRFHYGTDFAVIDGDAITAFADGKVISVQEIKGYGMTVMLDHGNGYTTLYAHCGQIQVKYGDKVKCGAAIALAGHSGLVTGPNLHFELMHNSKYLDPEFYL
jgi:murein DD-endopeptidase MepM/ murein hydrolase activator NlpD